MILKTIESGPLVVEVLYTNVAVRDSDTLESGRQKRRLQRSTCRFIRSLKRRMEALLLTNFDGSAWWVTLTYDDDHYHDDRNAVSRNYSYFLSKLRRAGCKSVRYVRVLEHAHGDKRWHIHAVIDGATKSQIRDAWIYGHAHICKFDPRKVVQTKGHGGLAEYICKERIEKVGQRAYSCSVGKNRLRDPDIRREVVPDGYSLSIPSGCRGIAGELLAVNPFGSSQYLSYMRGGF